MTKLEIVSERIRELVLRLNGGLFKTDTFPYLTIETEDKDIDLEGVLEALSLHGCKRFYVHGFKSPNLCFDINTKLMDWQYGKSLSEQSQETIDLIHDLLLPNDER